MMRKIKAFTMAEAILVMTILGIIATIMITTMKPAEFKKSGYETLAKTILGNLDTAIMQIVSLKTPDENLNSIYVSTTGTDTFAMNATGNGTYFVNLLKEYITTARGDVPASCTSGTGGFAANSDADAGMLFKNGACLAVGSGNIASVVSIIPGEEGTSTVAASHGVIYLDTNGDKEPNTLGVDRYVIPLDSKGIVSGN